MHRLLALLGVLALAACMQYPNRPLPQGVGNDQLYPYSDRADRTAADPFVIMSFSGGGVRATALAYSVLDELGKYTYLAGNGQRRSLLDDVQIVSSTSGGSVTAAYFALHGDADRRERLRALLDAFIYRDNMASLFWEAANPATWFKLASPGFSRVDLVRELFDERLFHGATYASIAGGGRPFVILNSTDIGSGVTFSFTPQYFDDICSDLASFPLATAVAASTAVPVALTPITLKNHSGETCWTTAMPKTISNSVGNVWAKYLNFANFKRARYEHALRRGQDAYGVIDYVHLVDGGLADNLGLRSLDDAVFAVNPSIRFYEMLNRAGIGKLVAIVVNARAGGPGELSQDGSTPGLSSMIASVTGDPINIVSDTADTAFQLMLDNLRGSMLVDAPTPLHSYLVEVDFDLLNALDPDQRALRDRAKRIPTSWSISREDVAIVDRAARLLLAQHPCFKLLLNDLKVEAAPAVVDNDRRACRWWNPN